MVLTTTVQGILQYTKYQGNWIKFNIFYSNNNEKMFLIVQKPNIQKVVSNTVIILQSVKNFQQESTMVSTNCIFTAIGL